MEDRQVPAKGAPDFGNPTSKSPPLPLGLRSLCSIQRRKMKGSARGPVDRIDMKILRALQADGRLTNAELAARVSVSPATCHRRTQRLFDEGYITGVRAEVAPAAVGLGALVMVGVVLD